MPDRHKAVAWTSKENFLCDYSFPRGLDLEICLEVHEHSVKVKTMISLTEIITNWEKKTKITLKNEEGTIKTEIFISWREHFDTSRLELNMAWRANHLPKFGLGFLSSTNPSLRFLRGLANGTYVEAAETETLLKTTTPNWKEVTLSMGKIFDLSQHLPFFKYLFLIILESSAGIAKESKKN